MGPLENSFVVIQKLHIVLPLDPKILVLRLKGTENICSHKNLYRNIHGNMIHKSQKVETTKMTINWWMDNQKVVLSTQFSHKQDWRTDATYNMDESKELYAVLKKLDKKACIAWFYMWNVYNRQVHRDRKYISIFQGLRRRRNGEWLLLKMGFLFWWKYSVIGDDGYNNLVNILKTTELYT